MSVEINAFLIARLQVCDALLIDDVVEEGQTIRAKIRTVYSRRFEGPIPYATGEIEFVGTPGHWGSPTLRTGDRAVVFVRFLALSNQTYQHAWRGHFRIEEVDGQEYATVTWNDGVKNWFPEEFANVRRNLDAQRPWIQGIPLNQFEARLRSVLKEQSGWRGWLNHLRERFPRWLGGFRRV